MIYLISQPGLSIMRQGCIEVVRSKGYKVVSVSDLIKKKERVSKTQQPGVLLPNNEIEELVRKSVPANWDRLLIDGLPATLDQCRWEKQLFSPQNTRKSTFRIQFSNREKIGGMDLALDNLIQKIKIGTPEENRTIATRRLTVYRHHEEAVEKYLKTATCFCNVNASFGGASVVSSFASFLESEMRIVNRGKDSEYSAPILQAATA